MNTTEITIEKVFENIKGDIRVYSELRDEAFMKTEDMTISTSERDKATKAFSDYGFVVDFLNALMNLHLRDADLRTMEARLRFHAFTQRELMDNGNLRASAFAIECIVGLLEFYIDMYFAV